MKKSYKFVVVVEFKDNGGVSTSPMTLDNARGFISRRYPGAQMTGQLADPSHPLYLQQFSLPNNGTAQIERHYA